MITIDELKPLENIINGFESNLIEYNLHKTDIHDIKETLFNIIDLYVKDNIINLKSYKFENEVYESINTFIEENKLFNNLIDLTDYIDECIEYYFNFIQIPRHYPNYITKNITKKFGLLSYIVMIIFILIVSSSSFPEHTSSSLAWASLGS